MIKRILVFALLFALLHAPVAAQPQTPLVSYKTPYEQKLLGADFTNVIGTDTFTIVSVTSYNTKSGADSTSIIIAASPAPFVVIGTDQVNFMVQGGNAGEVHHISVRVRDTVTSAQFEGIITLNIQQWP